jgi:hypothetical protein
MRLSDSAVGGREPSRLVGISIGMIDRDAIRLRWEADGSKRDERGRRLFAASEFPWAVRTLIDETGRVRVAGMEVVASLVSRIRE